MRYVMLILGLCLASGFASAQTFGEITGEVRDPSGAIAPGAAVSVTNTGTNAARSTTTNDAAPGQRGSAGIPADGAERY